jgi:hypothetical protein
MSNLDHVKQQLASNADVSAEYIMKILGVTKPYAYNLISKGRKELRMVKQRDGTWAHKARMATRDEKIVNPAIYETVAVMTSNTSIADKLTPPADSALDVQVGGGHYKDMKIQPVKFITENNLDFLTGCIIKRICRWKHKDGLKDLEKIKHEVDLIIELNGLK